jgi:hypothetical protein
MTLSPFAAARRRTLCAFPIVLAATLAGRAHPQLISIKTVPLAQGDQFDILPSQAAGMAGVSIALADSLLDPFVNPALGARYAGTRVFSSPTFFSFSGVAGGGRTFPLGAMTRGESWFGSVALAFQEVDPSVERRQFPSPLVEPFVPDPTVDLVPTFRRAPRDNRYAFATVGRNFAGANLSVGGAVRWAGLNAVDGVDLLYANSSHIRQFGNLVDLRLGAFKTLRGDRSLEIIALHNRVDMTHDVTYLDFFWDPTLRIQRPTPRVEHNVDRTNVWGLHLEYERPLAKEGWRLGTVLTGNLMSHPKIPNYEIMNIPRDPGHSYAYNVGFGVGNVSETGRFGVDIIYEPIWSNTWAEAASPIETQSGATIPAGGKTIENRFRFSNALVRFGVGQDVELEGRSDGLGIQLGLDMRQVHYWLEQTDNVQATLRNQEERWVEWTPTWGLSLRFPSLHLQYRGRTTTGTGRPGVADGVFLGGVRDLSTAAPSILLAPSGELTLDGVSVVSHQFSISLPIR